MPNLVAYNSGSPISNAIQFGTVVMDVNGDVPKGSLLWCPDFGICNQYIIITDSYTNGKTNQANSRPMGFKTPTLTSDDLIEAINKLAASKFAGPFLTLQTAINWAIYQGYFITNQEYPSIVTNGCVLNLDSNFPPSYPLVFDAWYDLTGNNNTGLLNNGVLYNDPLRGSLLFNGTNQYVSFSATTNIPVGNSDYTISAWFNPASLGTKGIVGWGNYGTTNAINVLKFSPIGVGNYWGNNDLTTTTYSFSTGNWYNVVATFDGTTRSIWVNGALITSDTPVGHNVPNSNNLTIGKTGTAEFFDGNIGEVQIFNRALDSTEISDNYNAFLPRYSGTYTDPCNSAPQCTPTPTGTPPTTPTPTPTISCYGFNLTPVYDNTCDRSGDDVSVYKLTSGSIVIGNTLYDGSCSGPTLSTGFYSDGTYRYVINNGVVSNKVYCIEPTPTQTQTNTTTPTPTMTVTPTGTHVIFAQCDVLFNSNISAPGGDYSEVYYLNTQTNVPRLLFIGTSSNDIAMTENKLWLYNGNSIYEYNIGLSGGFSVAYNREITCTNVGSNLGMAAKNDTTLIVGGSSIVELDITTSVATLTTLFNLPSGYRVSGDIVYNPLNNNLIISYDNGSSYYIGEFTYGGTVVNNSIYNKNTYGILWGMYSYSGGLFGLSNSGRLVSINLTTLALSLVTNIGVSVAGAAQTLNCPVIDVTPTPTVTPSPTSPPRYYNAYVYSCDIPGLTCSGGAPTETIIYSGIIDLSIGSYYSNGTTAWQPYGPTSNPGPGGYIDITGYLSTSASTCYVSCSLY